MEKTVLITGATSGIGEATARRLTEDGYSVIITGRRADRLEKLGDELQATTLCFDIRDREQTLTALSLIERVDVLVNNAGLAAGLEHIDVGDYRDWEAMIDTNIKGVLWATQAIVPKMIEAGGGYIVNIGSIAGIQTYENGAVYCASKHAMHALSQGMRIDLLSHNIRVTEIRPGMVETEFSEVRFHGDAERAKGVYKGVEPLTGDDIARTIAWVLSQPPHVNINDIEITPTAQASAYYTFRK
ncbi:Oxidoreductase, short chain dehydrogenase/reductase family [Mucinivorans hirudinis]|uniref:Oxidoreductase, short chain dehydrogenase/reductase family n=1 Tax=Mucinivorans hirudinis TaxID=1433126 RepID=A0A060RBX3_9BACT|nr:Oxidoreductase, short chain dehydrogenase/reductase family [Mucinivorans hirudinis]